MRLFIDTDIGDDIDDYLAIGLALQKRADIVGITTVFREAESRKNVAKRLLSAAGREDIPVLAGYSEPLSEETRVKGKLNYGASLGQKDAFDPEKAVDFIIESVKRYKKDLTLLVIGAQTNVAKAVLKAPEIMQEIGLCVIMGGAFYIQHDEWNIACDPLAAKIVSESGMPLAYVPWDVTSRISVGAENNEYILNTPFDGLKKAIAENVSEWGKGVNIPLLHDPAALYYCLHPEWFKVKKMHVKFIADGELAGLSLNLDTFTGLVADKRAYPSADVVVSAENETIVNDFMKTVFEKE